MATCSGSSMPCSTFVKGALREAEQTLREAARSLRRAEQTSYGRSALAMLTDDNTARLSRRGLREGPGRAFLASTNLMNGGEDAQAYSLQITDKQQQIIDAGVDKDGENPKLVYKQVALGPYLRGLFLARKPTRTTTTCRRLGHGRQLAAEFRLWPARPGTGPAWPSLGARQRRAVRLRVDRLGPLQRGNDRIAQHGGAVDRGPDSERTNKYTLPPTVAPIKVPKVVVPPNVVDRVRVFADGRPVGETATITNIAQLATEQYEAVYPQVIARAVVRRVVKKGVIYGTKTAMNIDRNSLWDIGLDVVGVAWEATEAADMRCWGLLPEKIQVLRVELPQGEHEIALQGIGSTLPGTPRAERREDHQRPQHVHAGQFSRHGPDREDSDERSPLSACRPARRGTAWHREMIVIRRSRRRAVTASAARSTRFRGTSRHRLCR